MVGESVRMRAMYRQVEKLASSDIRTLPTGLTLFELERRYVTETLERAGGNRTQAAKVLGISLRGLQYRLRRYDTNGHHASASEGSTVLA
jgi:DNA-binding NtrC family response regulator